VSAVRDPAACDETLGAAFGALAADSGAWLSARGAAKLLQPTDHHANPTGSQPFCRERMTAKLDA
jgi:hypothetical protein